MEKSKRFQNKKLKKTNNKVKNAAKGTKRGIAILGAGAFVTTMVKKHGEDVVRVIKNVASR